MAKKSVGQAEHRPNAPDEGSQTVSMSLMAQLAEHQRKLISEALIEIMDLGVALRHYISIKDTCRDVYPVTRGMIMRVEDLAGAVSDILDDQPIESVQAVVQCIRTGDHELFQAGAHAFTLETSHG